MRLDSALTKSRRQYISAQKISTLLMDWMHVKLQDNFQMREHSWPCRFHINNILAIGLFRAFPSSNFFRLTELSHLILKYKEKSLAK